MYRFFILSMHSSLNINKSNLDRLTSVEPFNDLRGNLDTFFGSQFLDGEHLVQVNNLKSISFLKVLCHCGLS